MLCTLALLGAPAAFAVPITDEKIGEALLSNSGDDTELAKLRELTGIATLELGSKFDVSKKSPISLVEGENPIWILTDLAAPGYFALKFGTGSTGASADTFFFKNIGDMSQLVWSNAQVQFLTGWSCNGNGTKCEVERLSHYLTAPAVPVKTEQGSNQAGTGTTGGIEAGSGAVDSGLIGGGQAGGGLETGSQEGGGQELHDVPEPGSLALLAIGALAFGRSRRRSRN